MTHKISKKENNENLNNAHKGGIHKTYNYKLWEQIIELGKKNEPASKGITNKFSDDDIMTIIGTMEFFGATDIWIKQTIWDLKVAKYRLFDWLAMCVMSRNDDNREVNNESLKVLVHSYLKVGGDPKKFIQDLRETDYQLDESWKKIKIDVEKNSNN
ncbi:MAG: hypothetical protein QXO70_04835 [Candidatus Pacearchaeota archaeon]